MQVSMQPYIEWLAGIFPIQSATWNLPVFDWEVSTGVFEGKMAMNEKM